jgi:hypothetical protein
LAVVNNPDLKVVRADAHVSQAQAFAAGLLPEMQNVCFLYCPTSRAVVRISSPCNTATTPRISADDLQPSGQRGQFRARRTEAY